MSPKTFAVVAVATLVAVIAALVSVGRDQSDLVVAGTGERIFPALLERVNDVTTLSVEHAKGSITLEKGDAGWTVKESGDYQGRAVKIQRTILGLARLRLVESKTRLKEKYAKLGLQDRGSEGSNSKRVKLFDGKGALLGDLLVGKESVGSRGEGSGGLYVRRPGNVQTWLTEGASDITDRRRDWLERKIINIEAKRIRRIVIHHPGGEIVILSKASLETKDFALDNMPKGKKLIDAGTANSVGKALADLLLDDVRKGPQAFDAAGAVSADFTTFNGLLVSVLVSKEGDKNWIRLDVSAEQAAEDGAQEEARGIMARTSGWVYGISDYAASNLMKHLDGLTWDLKPKS